MTFSIFNLLGGILFGLFFQRFPVRKHHFTFHIVALIIGMSCIFVIYLKNMEESEKWTLLVLVALIGFSIGGLYDCFLTNEMLIVA